MNAKQWYQRSKLDLLQSPPSASSSEQSSSHEGEEEESSSEGLTPQPKPKPHSSSTGHSGSESDSDSEPEDTLRSVPVAQAATKKARSKPSPKAPTPAVAKRPAETQPGKKESKKANQGKGDAAAEKSTARVWSEEDEIAILKGMIDYAEKIGLDPSSDMEAFHSFVKKSLHADASRSQLYDKVRRLKRKYWDNAEKLKKDGSVSSSWKTHDKKLFDLSKKIWRTEDNGMQSPKSDKTRSARKAEKIANQNGAKPNATLLPKNLEMSPTPLVDAAKGIQEMDCEKNLAPVVNLAKDHLLHKKLGSGDLETYVLEKGLDLIKGQQRAELEERWANLHKAQLKVFVERTKLILDQAKLVLAAHK